MFEGNIITDLALAMNCQIYVEIGIGKGLHFQRMSRYSKTIAAVDDKPLPVPLPHNAYYFQTTPEIFAQGWKTPIDLLSIAADHRKEMMLSDFDVLSPLVKPDTGLILLHDTYPPVHQLLSDASCGNAWRIAEELAKRPGWESVTIPGPWAGITIMRRKTKSLIFMEGLYGAKEESAGQGSGETIQLPQADGESAGPVREGESCDQASGVSDQGRVSELSGTGSGTGESGTGSVLGKRFNRKGGR